MLRKILVVVAVVSSVLLLISGTMLRLDMVLDSGYFSYKTLAIACVILIVVVSFWVAITWEKKE